MGVMVSGFQIFLRHFLFAIIICREMNSHRIAEIFYTHICYGYLNYQNLSIFKVIVVVLSQLIVFCCKVLSWKIFSQIHVISF